MSNHQAICWIDGEFVSPQNAKISVFDHGLLYGDGVFEGIRFYFGNAFRLPQHLKRLTESAAAIDLSIPLTLKAIESVILEGIKQFTKPEGYIRLIITRGVGSLGLSPSHCKAASIIVIFDDISVNEQSAHGISCTVSSIQSMNPGALDPRIKSLNYLNHVLAKAEAHRRGFSEAIMLNQTGHVAEASAENIFFVIDNEIHTPKIEDGGLEGITRHVIIELAKLSGYAIRERSIDVQELPMATECFLSGTGAELVSVYKIDDQTILHTPGPVFQSLQQAFMSTIRKECAY